MRRRVRKLVLVLIGAMLPFVLLEIVLRLVDPFGTAEVLERERYSAALLERDEFGTLRLRPGAHATLLGAEARIGPAGLRTPPFATPKPAGTFRVLVLGDSVAFGWGVADDAAFPRVLERDWNAGGAPAGRERVEVINAGVPGWGAPNELLWLRDHGLALEPDLVLVTFINNDLTDVLQVIAPADGPEPLRLPTFLRGTYLGQAVEHGLAIVAGRTAAPEFFAALDLSPDAVAKASSALCIAYGEMKRLCGDIPFAVMDTVGNEDGSRRLEPFVACMDAAAIPRIDCFLGRPDYLDVYAISRSDFHPNATGQRALAAAALAWARAHVR